MPGIAADVFVIVVAGTPWRRHADKPRFEKIEERNLQLVQLIVEPLVGTQPANVRARSLEGELEARQQPANSRRAQCAEQADAVCGFGDLVLANARWASLLRVSQRHLRERVDELGKSRTFRRRPDLRDGVVENAQPRHQL